MGEVGIEVLGVIGGRDVEGGIFFGAIGGEFFGGIGNISFSSSRSVVRYNVMVISDLVYNVLPHFSKFELAGSKLPNFIV